MFEGVYRRRRLPHWDVEGGAYFVTTCLKGSIPAQGLVELDRYRDKLESQTKPADYSKEEWETRKHKLVFARFDSIIDAKPAVKHLENPKAAEIVRDAFYFFAGERYQLLAFVVMPSHFHWVFQPCPKWVDSLSDKGGKRTPRERIMKSICGYTAYRCNRLLGLIGAFWQHESYDHVVRDYEELLRIVRYIENNPVKAGLVASPQDWRWSSAADRPSRTVVPGQLALK
jgi:REP-associated tyrosine transposase